MKKRETNKRTYKGSVTREAQKYQQNYIQKQFGQNNKKLKRFEKLKMKLQN